MIVEFAVVRKVYQLRALVRGFSFTYELRIGE